MLNNWWLSSNLLKDHLIRKACKSILKKIKVKFVQALIPKGKRTAMVVFKYKYIFQKLNNLLLNNHFARAEMFIEAKSVSVILICWNHDSCEKGGTTTENCIFTSEWISNIFKDILLRNHVVRNDTIVEASAVKCRIKFVRTMTPRGRLGLNS